MVKHIDPAPWGPEKDKIRVLVLSGWPGGKLQEMVLDTTMGKHVLASAKVKQTPADVNYLGWWDQQTVAIVFQSITTDRLKML